MPSPKPSAKVSKVLLLCDFFSSLGGTENYNAALARGLRDAGIDVRIYVGEKPSLDHWKSKLISDGFYFKEPSVYHEDLNSSRIEKDFISEIVDEINDWKPDIIHVHPFRKSAIQWLSNPKANTSIPLVATEWTVPNENAANWFELDAPLHINKVHTYIATCEAIKGGLRSYNQYTGPIVSIPHIIKDIPNTQPTHTPKTINSVGCISRLSVEKGLVFLIGAWKQVHKHLPSTTLHIYGHGPQLDELTTLRDALGLKDTIIFEGTFKPSEVNSIASRHSVFVQPSLFESIPTSIIELMLSGRVIVASDVGGVSELIHDGSNGIITESGNTNEIAQGIITLVSSPELIEQYSARAYSDSHQIYNYKKTIDSIIELYTSIKSEITTKTS